MKKLIFTLLILTMTATVSAARDEYQGKSNGVNAPSRYATVVTPSDTVDLVNVPRALWVGVEGDVTVIMADDATTVLLKNASGLLPVMVKRVLATGTTATNIIALY